MKRRYSREYALEVLYANELNPQTEKINSEIYKKLSNSGKPVSYTHLTLPTICSV